MPKAQLPSLKAPYGVREYIVWQVFDQKIDWFSLENGDYIPLVTDENGIIRSRVFPGLWLELAAMLEGNMPQVLSVLQAGINSAEVTAFVQQLADVRSGN